jgi:hypothetical protein
VENLLRRREAEGFAGSCVEQTLELGELGAVPFGKKSRMRPLVFSFKPRSHARYGVAKKILAFGGMGDVLMPSELLSVVEGDGVHEVADGLERYPPLAGPTNRAPVLIPPRRYAVPS